MVKTVSLSGGVTPIDMTEDDDSGFHGGYRFVWITNRTGSAVFASADDTCSAGADGTFEIRANESLRMTLTPGAVLYLDGSGDVELMTVPEPDMPFTSSGGSGGSGTSDYTALSNKPRINGVTLNGDKSFENLNLKPITRAQIDALFE